MGTITVVDCKTCHLKKGKCVIPKGNLQCSVDPFKENHLCYHNFEQDPDAALLLLYHTTGSDACPALFNLVHGPDGDPTTRAADVATVREFLQTYIKKMSVTKTESRNAFAAEFDPLVSIVTCASCGMCDENGTDACSGKYWANIAYMSEELTEHWASKLGRVLFY